MVLCACEEAGNLKPAKGVSLGVANLISPSKNELCTSGTNVSSNQSIVFFKWNSADKADKYELHLKNLITAQTDLYSVKKNELSITLNRSTPYSWYVVSISDKVSDKTTSDVWRFYNSGLGVVSYAPFPAEILSPGMAQMISSSSGKVTLDWNGSDVDADISSYDVYFGKSPSPSVFKSNVKESVLNDVDVEHNTTYYWKIITRDQQGNLSDSGVYQFNVN